MGFKVRTYSHEEDFLFTLTLTVICSQCVWPHQLQVRLGAGQSRLQTVLPPSVHWVRLRLLAALRPAGDAPLHIQYLHQKCACIVKLNPHFSVVTPRGRSASWARSGVSGKGRTQRSVLKEKATPRLSPPNPVSALRKTSPGEHRLHRFAHTDKLFLQRFIFRSVQFFTLPILFCLCVKWLRFWTVPHWGKTMLRWLLARSGFAARRLSSRTNL